MGQFTRKAVAHYNYSKGIDYNNYYKAINSLSKASNTNVKLDGVDTPNHIILCTLKIAEANGGKCPKSGAKLEKPAYLVKWSRFGNVSKYKWNGSGWNRQ